MAVLSFLDWSLIVSTIIATIYTICHALWNTTVVDEFWKNPLFIQARERANDLGIAVGVNFNFNNKGITLFTPLTSGNVVSKIVPYTGNIHDLL
jgi:hypothetical protein